MMMRNSLLSAAAALLALTVGAGAARPAMAQASDQYLGQLMTVGFTYCPRGWSEANGQLLSIAQNSPLFSLFGTLYGGDGQTTFALPDLRGRVSEHVGTGPGLAPVAQGQRMGSDTTTLTVSQMPMHTHLLLASSGTPDAVSPNNALLPTFAGANVYSAAGAANVPMKTTAIGVAGGNEPFDQHQPSLVLRYCVAMEGVYPSPG